MQPLLCSLPAAAMLPLKTAPGPQQQPRPHCLCTLCSCTAGLDCFSAQQQAAPAPTQAQHRPLIMLEHTLRFMYCRPSRVLLIFTAPTSSCFLPWVVSKP